MDVSQIRVYLHLWFSNPGLPTFMFLKYGFTYIYGLPTFMFLKSGFWNLHLWFSNPGFSNPGFDSHIYISKPKYRDVNVGFKT